MTIHEQLIQLALDNPEATIAIIMAILGSVGHYRRTGKLPLGRLPWQAARQMFRQLGDKYFPKERRKDVPSLLVKVDQDTLELALRHANMESVDLYSFEVDGEVLNLRRPEPPTRHPFTERRVPMELHVRTFDTDRDGWLLLQAHHEASRFEGTGPHIDESMLSWEEGRQMVKEILVQNDLQFRNAVEQDGGFTVV